MLIASYLEPDLVAEVRRRVPEVEVIYRPDLLYEPAFPGDHTSVTHRAPEQEFEWRDLLKSAEILYDFDHTHEEDLPELAPNLRWIQATSAGIGPFVTKMRYDVRTPWVFTTASGIHARPLGEFVIMSMLLFVKDIFVIQRQQAQHHWMRYAGSELADYTLGVVGLGNVGREVARLAKTFDMRVLGSRRGVSTGDIGGTASSHLDKLFRPDELPELLAQSDFLCLSCPLTPETEGLIGAEEISRLPQGAVIINIARGPVVEEKAMIEALRSGHLRGAVLDVFKDEPLPPDSPFWSMPNVVVSPHSGSTSVGENRRLTDLFCDNLRRYIEGRPLRNVLDTEKRY